MSDQSNPEKTVKCPVEGCEAEKLARGIYLHIRQSKGDGHGPQGEIPEDLNLDNLEAVGTRDVSMDYPDTRTTENVGRVCPYCEEVFRGKQGVMIHLGRTAGKSPHPENPKERIDSENLSIVHSDEEDNATVQVIKQTAPRSNIRRQEQEKKKSLSEKIERVIDEFRQEEKHEAADRLEQVLDQH